MRPSAIYRLRAFLYLSSMERWKDIKGFEGIYEISSFGNVISKHNNNIKFLKLRVNAQGYLFVCLQNKSRKEKRINRLVAEAFIPNPNSLPEVNHKNGDKANNSISNLEWCTKSHNERHAHTLGLKNHKGVKNPNSKLNELKVRVIKRLKGELPNKEVSSIFGVSESHIYNIQNNNRHVFRS